MVAIGLFVGQKDFHGVRVARGCVLGISHRESSDLVIALGVGKVGVDSSGLRVVGCKGEAKESLLVSLALDLFGDVEEGLLEGCDRSFGRVKRLCQPAR